MDSKMETAISKEDMAIEIPVEEDECSLDVPENETTIKNAAEEKQLQSLITPGTSKKIGLHLFFTNTRDVFELDELSLEISRIAIPAVLALATDLLVSLICCICYSQEAIELACGAKYFDNSPKEIPVFYLLAKVEEAEDKVIYEWTHHTVSGHTLKHLCATMVPIFLTLMLTKWTVEPERKSLPQTWWIYWIKVKEGQSKIENIDSELRPVTSTLTRLYHESSEALGGTHANASKNRRLRTTYKKLELYLRNLIAGTYPRMLQLSLVSYTRLWTTETFLMPCTSKYTLRYMNESFTGISFSSSIIKSEGYGFSRLF